jgi:hypothetical protein
MMKKKATKLEMIEMKEAFASLFCLCFCIKTFMGLSFCSATVWWDLSLSMNWLLMFSFFLYWWFWVLVTTCLAFLFCHAEPWFSTSEWMYVGVLPFFTPPSVFLLQVYQCHTTNSGKY